MTQPAFLEWSSRGFTAELVRVTPWNAPDVAERYRGKRPVDGAWQSLAVTPALVSEWARLNGANVGVRTRAFPAVDIDVDDPGIAEACAALVVAELGTTSVRHRGNSPRRVLLYRLAGAPFKKSKVEFTAPDGTAHKVEFLADGQQVVVAGRHHTGADLEWSPCPPAAAELPELTGATRDALTEKLRARLVELGCTVKGAAPRTKPVALVSHGLSDADEDRALADQALDRIDPDSPYEEWLRVGMALHSKWPEAGGTGFALWDGWSSRGAKYPGSRELETKWSGFAPGGGVSFGTLLHKGGVSRSRSRAFASREAGASGRPTIIVHAQVDEVVDQAIDALAETPGLYQRAGALVEVVREAARPAGIQRPAAAPGIVEIREPRMLELLSRAATWMSRDTQKGSRQVLPPKWAVQAALARQEWKGIPPLLGVVEAPVLRVDGSILREPGYDRDTGLFYAPPVPLDLSIPAAPTRADAARAAGKLLDVVADFPFGDPAGPVAWLAAVLTPLCRFAFPGPAPLFLFDGNTRGCGKSLLTDVIGVIAAGRDMARLAAPAEDEEMEKRITALALAGDPLILIDNIVGPFGWPSLDAALTGQSWNARILGHSRMTGRLDLLASWYATGNNVALAADAVRRVLHIRLETLEERPEERRGFKHPDLRAHVQAERPRLLADALTILRAYCHAGRPPQDLPPWGSFEAWSALVRGALVWAGLCDPAAGRSEYVSRADDERTILDALLTGWELVNATLRGATVAEVVKRASGEAREGDLPALQALRWALTELGGEPVSARRVGNRLKKLEKRVVQGRFFERGEDSHGVTRWVVRRPAPGG